MPYISYSAIISFAFIVLANHLVAPVNAQEHQREVTAELQSFAERLNRSARSAAISSGSAHVGAIACDPSGFSCTCQGAFDCAWLAYGCAKVGGVQGLDGECYLPGNDREVNRAVLDLRLTLLPGPLHSTCEGPICSCSGPADSADCTELGATCIDDVQCIGDSCGCIGGTPSE